jgi:hypothetical protein
VLPAALLGDVSNGDRVDQHGFSFGLPVSNVHLRPLRHIWRNAYFIAWGDTYLAVSTGAPTPDGVLGAV